METKTDERFDKTDERFDRLETKFDERCDRLETKTDERFDKTDGRFDRMDDRIDDLTREVVANGRAIARIEGRHEGHPLAVVE